MIGAIPLLPLSAFVASIGQIYLLPFMIIILFFFTLYNVASLNLIVKTCVVERIVIIIIGHELDLDRSVSVSPNGLFKSLLIHLLPFGL